LVGEDVRGRDLDECEAGGERSLGGGGGGGGPEGDGSRSRSFDRRRSLENREETVAIPLGYKAEAEGEVKAWEGRRKGWRMEGKDRNVASSSFSPLVAYKVPLFLLSELVPRC